MDVRGIFPKLRGAIAERGDTLDVLTAELGISARNLRRSLNGERDFTLCEAAALSKRYKIGIDTLFQQTNHDARRNGGFSASNKIRVGNTL
jgi:hypothetical protein